MRKVPSVDKVLGHPAVEEVLARIPRTLVLDSARAAVEEVRAKVRAGEDVAVDIDRIAARAKQLAERESGPSLRPAVNATGVILHTGLGRAVLAPEARTAAAAVAADHSTLEIDTATGRRGSRIDHVEGLLCKLTGAEAATVVNNNAAAVLLGINTLARGREVIISRGQLVEIGGQFRIPDIISSAGCRLVEVGTTNRTRIEDYENAVGEDTTLILRVHPSNFRLVGFTEEASLSEMVELGRSRNIPVMDDLGSGALIDLARFGLKDEPLAQDSVRSGADLITFSGDKLLGGPQAGIVIGRHELVEGCRRNPLARVLRVDKFTLAALEATLRLYIDPEQAINRIPALRYIARHSDEIARLARRLAARIRALPDSKLQVEVVSVRSQVGGGSLPGQHLASKGVALKSKRLSTEDLSSRFRQYRIPIFGRIEDDKLVLDLRTVEPTEIETILHCARELTDRSSTDEREP